MSGMYTVPSGPIVIAIGRSRPRLAALYVATTANGFGTAGVGLGRGIRPASGIQTGESSSSPASPMGSACWSDPSARITHGLAAEPLPRFHAIQAPSGDHVGLASSSLPIVSWCRPVPLALTTQMPLEPAD